MKGFCWYTILLFTVFAAPDMILGSDEHCDAKSLTNCQSNFEKLLEIHFKEYEKTEADIDSYCQKVEDNGVCVKDISASCVKKYPKVFIFISSINGYLSKFCSESRQVFTDMIPCFKKHDAEFNKCFLHPSKYQTKKDFEDVCSEWLMECIAKTSRKFCDKSEKFAKILEDTVKEVKSEICKSSQASASATQNLATVVGFCLILWLNKQYTKF